jgi:polyprenyl-phospho-N-acetylgalactosaminyl synthase
MKTYIVIPAYNEEGKIGEVIQGLIKQRYANIVVVDDGSTDRTAMASSKATVLRHAINRGQGAALKTGIDYALSVGADIIVTFDADGQHHPEDIPALIAPIMKRKADIALGSRFIRKGSNPPLLRKLALKGGALVFRLLYGARLSDSHNGLRALSRRAASVIRITCDDMTHASEIIEEIKLNKLKYVEVPVKITYTEYSLKKGQSTLNGARILFKMVFKKLFR